MKTTLALAVLALFAGSAAHAYYFDFSDAAAKRVATSRFSSCREAENTRLSANSKATALLSKGRSSAEADRQIVRQAKALQYVLDCACNHDWSDIRQDMLQARIQAGCRQ